MGTETVNWVSVRSTASDNKGVKLNNPLMGTETLELKNDYKKYNTDKLN